ncbi:ATP-dependent Clp protease proteolytic subunit [Microlunatus endophyticus]|uniref:ATP-dependent Clp protease proteolytic subunit n=1 Tax=Microlunatus endophyticus TaxID=1716077 RepID=A0A917S958_9ACTN|nr:ATP-dependent Clp protease proteolytic subunit [Microlunatus endophyticus]GGL63830.1 ATP-dependent Clp protease proteolytic subunit [Microlunatus endophyticus]
MSQYSIPTVVEKTIRGERVSDIYSRLLSDRIVFLGTPIDDGVANVIIAQLLHLDSENSEQDIGFYINSPGGSLTALMGIYDTMQFISAQVATVCIGQAASSAAVLLAAGAAGKRSVLPHSRILLHQPSGSAEGTLPDLAVQAKEIARLRSQLNEVLSRHTGQPIDKIKTDTDRDLILTPEEAVGYGVVDRVMQPREASAAAYRIG